MRRLDVYPESDNVAIAGPVVVQVEGDVPQVAANLLRGVDKETGQPVSDALAYDPGDGVLHPVQLAGDGGLTLSDDGTTATFSSVDGTSYSVRRIVDEDGTWASGVDGPAPADSLERLYRGDIDVDDRLESLWAALDPDTGELRDLIYSSPTGVYARADGGWRRFPEDDASLDGLESVDVTGDAIAAYDKAAGKLTRDDLTPFVVPETEEVADEGAPAGS